MILFPKQNSETKAQNIKNNNNNNNNNKIKIKKLNLSQLSRWKSDLQTITIKAKVKNASFRVKNEPKLSKKNSSFHSCRPKSNLQTITI